MFECWEAVSRDRWEHTAEIWTILANAHSMSGKKFTPADVNPWLRLDKHKDDQEHPEAAAFADELNRLLAMPGDLAAGVIRTWQAQESEPDERSSN